MASTKRSLGWARVACVAVTAAALFFVLRRINPEALKETVRTMHPGWFLAGVALYGLLFLPAAWRWHLALRLNGNAVHFGITTRFSLIGHFFYNVLFGAAGGDTAKSVLYARWYQVPLPEVLAAAALDRLMGLGGLILFAGAAFAIAAANGGFAGAGSVSVQSTAAWLLLGVIVAATLLLLAFKRARPGSAAGRFAGTFTQSGRQLISSPKTILPGLLCGLLVQMALSGVLALNLQAVSHTPLPWLRLVWTFPAISVISALPISVAGLGVRDTAALALLGLCGVPGADAVAASLLTALTSLVWTVIAGGLLWRESNRQQARPASPIIATTISTSDKAGS